jgi:CRISPR type I-E-associated protein CasB/Cse2
MTLMATEQMNDALPKRPRHYASIIGAAGKALGSDWYPNGHRAELKRYEPARNTAGETAALRLLISADAQLDAMRPAEIRSWIWLLHCMALLSAPNRDPHSTGHNARPGVVLHRIGYSEGRLSRLLDARGDTFNTLLERTVRRIARHGEQLNWSQVAPLLLSRDEESAWAENARLAIARDYFTAKARDTRDLVKGAAEASSFSVEHS